MGSCNSALMKPCLSETDIRYDANYPKDIVEQDINWQKLSGFFRVNLTNFDPVDGGRTKSYPYIPGVPATYDGPFDQGSQLAFYNHTIDGSRMIINRYYFMAPASQSFCQIPFQGLNAPPGLECGVNGNVQFAGLYAALNHENDGTLSMARSTGLYSLSTPSLDLVGSEFKLTGNDTYESVTLSDGFSSTSSIVFLDDDSATLSVVVTSTTMKQILRASTATVVRLTEDEFLAGIQESNTEYNVPVDRQMQSPMTSNEVSSLKGTFPTEEEWCGGLIEDASCTPTPYLEPDAQMKNGFIALFVILGCLVLITVGFLLHRNAKAKQKKRYKAHFVRGIAKNITIAPSAGMISAEELKKEFDFIDKDKGGTISRDELNEFVESGKIGIMEKKDFDAMFSALDIDNSGEIDFVEFAAFLSSCGSEFDKVNQEQKAMTADEKFMSASRRLSTMESGAVAAAALQVELVGEESEQFADNRSA